MNVYLKVNLKKFNRILIAVFFALIIAIGGICVREMRNDYAELVLGESDDEKNSCSVFLNGKEEYIPLPYYSYDWHPSIFIRNGKNPLIALLREDFGFYAVDEERTFIYCDEAIWGYEIPGLFIKKGMQNKLFKPTKENIQKIIISADYQEVLIVTHEDEICFERFLKKYKKQLEDYTYKLNFNGDTDFENKRYGVDIYYGDGDMSRFFGYIGQKDFDKIRRNYHLSKNTVA